jgi:transposase
MGNPAGVRRNFDALEKRRLEAMRLLDEGLNQSEVARRVKVVRQTVARWAKHRREHGLQALWKAGRAGRKPKLTDKDRRRLAQRLLEGPERLGYETPLWTCPRVADLIEREFGIRYHSGHVWKLLIGLGWSPQRPTGRARERNAEAIRQWRQKTWPAIKKSAPARADDRLCRREWAEPAAASLPDLGAAWPDAGAGIQL